MRQAGNVNADQTAQLAFLSKQLALMQKIDEKPQEEIAEMKNEIERLRAQLTSSVTEEAPTEPVEETAAVETTE